MSKLRDVTMCNLRAVKMRQLPMLRLFAVARVMAKLVAVIATYFSWLLSGRFSTLQVAQVHWSGSAAGVSSASGILPADVGSAS